MHSDEKIKSVLSFSHELACSDTLVPAKLVKKCYKVGSIGQLNSKMHLIFARCAIDAKW